MKIDCFTHVTPRRYLDEFARRVPAGYHFSDISGKIPELVEMSLRLEMMEQTGVDQQVITLAAPGPEEIIDDPKAAHQLAVIANDTMADLCVDYPDKFIPVGNYAMNNVTDGVAEAERCIKELGMKGMLMYTNVRGSAIDAEAFFPFYEVMEDLDLPIWLHPARGPDVADYADESMSKHVIWQIFGWPYETTAAMTRLIFAGVFDRFPKLKIITHHAGAMLPGFDKRIEYVYPLFKHLGMTSKELDMLQKPVLDYYRMFYNDTALMGSVGGMTAALAFFGSDHLLFGTDTPLDTFGGRAFTEETITSIEALPLPPKAKAEIYSGNLKRLLHL
ncbi:MAG: amidohydrolase family protein [Immundisolibacteraceae bacterium]|nr:amidohydrolase family protein [Immundisolibacteraceae bacterium]